MLLSWIYNIDCSPSLLHKPPREQHWPEKFALWLKSNFRSFSAVNRGDSWKARMVISPDNVSEKCSYTGDKVTLQSRLISLNGKEWKLHCCMLHKCYLLSKFLKTLKKMRRATGETGFLFSLQGCRHRGSRKAPTFQVFAKKSFSLLFDIHKSPNHTIYINNFNFIIRNDPSIFTGSISAGHKKRTPYYKPLH